MGDFEKRINELLERVGDGRLRGEVRIDQVYARYQHERPDLHHSVGNMHFLSIPLNTHYRSYFEHIGDKVLDEGGGIVQGMVSSCESLANSSSTQTPVDFNNLSRSAGITVRDQGAVVYHREPRQQRLSEAELKALRRGRRRKGRR